MKLYAQYMKEREDVKVRYNENSFISYKQYDDNTVFAIDMYSIPELRGTGVMLEFVTKFVKDLKEDGVRVIYSSTDITTNGWERSERVMLEFGFKRMKSDDKNINNYYLKL